MCVTLLQHHHCTHSSAACTPASPTSSCLPCPEQLNSRETTAEGLDASFAANTLGTLALTQQLLPALERGAPSRVVFVSSGGQYTGEVAWERGGGKEEG